jgi:hypothetical protein
MAHSRVIASLATLATSTLAVCVLTHAAAAQTGRGSMDGMPGMPGTHHASAAVSAAALKQIDSVARVITPLGASGAASAAGYRPVFGWIPTMGVHWVDQSRMMKSRQTARATPGQLMFSKVGGKDSLVGAAYGYFTPVIDSTPPQLFDGSPVWHEHADLAPPGQRLVMLHVWFVPSPDGPFAGTNPNLPFWAVGLAAPDSARIHDAAFGARVRHASLALAEVADTLAIFPQLEQRPEVRAVVPAQRDSIRALIPELLAAQTAKDAARWDRAAGQAAAHWDAMYTAYLAGTRTPAARARVEKLVAMLLGQHGE